MPKKKPLRQIAEGGQTEAPSDNAAQQWQAMFDAVGDAIFLLDASHRIRRCNLAAETLFAKSAVEMVGRFCHEIVHGTAAPTADCPYLRLRDSLRREVTELAIDDRYFRVTVDPLTDAAGNLTGAVHIVSDITDRDRADAALQESEAKYRTLFEQAADAIVVFDPKTLAILDFNDEACRHLGYTREEFAKLKICDFEVIESAEQVKRHSQQVIATGLNVFETKHRTKSGAVLDIEVRTKSIRLAGEDLIQCVWRDIAARKQGEAETRRLHDAVAQEKDRLLALLNSINDEIWFADTEGRFTLTNPSARMEFCLGTAGATNVQQLAESLEVLRADGTPRPVEETPPLRALRGEVVRNLEEMVRTPASGELRYRQVNSSPVRDARGNIVGSISVVRDITDRKRAEAEIQSLNATLERRVAERTKALQMLGDVAVMVNQAHNVEQALAYCLRRVAEFNSWNFGHALLPVADNPDELILAHAYYREDSERFRRFHEATRGVPFHPGQCLVGRVVASGKPEWTSDLRHDLIECRAAVAEELDIATAMAVPVLVGSRVAAVLEFFSDRVIRPDRRMIDAMAGVGMQLGRVIERVKLEEHLLTTAENVQRHIAQDLHDDVGQELTGLGLKMETLAEMLPPAETPAGRLAADIAEAVDRTRYKVRGLSRRLLPVELEEGLLADALQRLALATTGPRIACTLDCSRPALVFDGRVATQLYHIAQEAVSNAVRHSQARNIRIVLDREDGKTVLAVEDDGTGLPGEAVRAGGMGLRSMRYRAELIGGELGVGPGPERGTRVVCRLAPPPPIMRDSHSNRRQS